MSETQQPLPTTPDAQEIDDQSLEQVVGGAVAAAPKLGMEAGDTDEFRASAPRTASFGGEDWMRK